MSDIVDRIRSVETTPLHGTDQWVELWKVLQDARAEIERLRSQPCPYVTGTVTKYCTLNLSENPNSSTLTDAERAALRAVLEDPDLVIGNARDPLRGLLERTK